MIFYCKRFPVLKFHSLSCFLMCKYIFENKNVAIDMIYVKNEMMVINRTNFIFRDCCVTIDSSSVGPKHEIVIMIICTFSSNIHSSVVIKFLSIGPEKRR